MKVQFLGTGVGIPQPDRVQSGFVVEPEDGGMLLFDCGAGILQQLFESGRDPLAVDAIVLSHLHLDHVSDVLPLLKSRWLCDQPKCRIIGPDGTREWLDRLFGAYTYLQGRFDLSIKELKPGGQMDLEGLHLSCAAGIHSIPSLGYRLEEKTSVLAYSGDTEPCDSIMELAKGADLLIHECSFPLNFMITNHTTPDMLVPYLKTPDIDSLYLTHLYPHMQGHEKEALECIRRDYRGDVGIATDLMSLEI